MKKRGNISLVMLTALVTVSVGAVLLNMAVNSRANTKTETKRIQNRYIAESGVDLAAGMFINYLDNRELTASYETDGDGNGFIIEDLCPYILDEIKDNPDIDEVPIEIIEKEARDYLISLGYRDFGKEGSLKVFAITNGPNDDFKVCNLCTEPDFLFSNGAEFGKKRSKLKPIYLKIRSIYPNGNVIANMEIDNIYAVRDAFTETEDGELGNVKISIDTENAQIKILNYQNYGGRD